METLLFALNAIMPIVLLIFFGYFLKKKSFLEKSWFMRGNTFIFKVCLPCLLFINVYNIEALSSINWSVVIYSEIAVVVIFFLALLLVKTLVPDNKQKGVIWQCTFRSNFAIIGLPLAEALGGVEAKGIAAVLSAFSIPTFNILAVIALTMFTGGKGDKRTGVKDVLKKVAKNPLIIGVLLGLGVLCIRAILPQNSYNMPVFTIKENLPFIFTAVNNIAKISSPLALIILGGLFDFSAIKELKRQIIIGTSCRIFITPLLVIGTAVILSSFTPLLRFDSAVYPALIALFASPVAVSSAIMAQEMDNDGTLAGQLVVWTSIFSIFTLVLFIVVLRSLSLL